MAADQISLERTDERALPYVEDVLEANDLPADDVRDGAGHFYVAHCGEEQVGVGGIERYGTDGLLRSVVVRAPHRGDGLGAALCASLEAEARSAGVETLYLLTTTAAGFFASQGYEQIDRGNAPVAIRETTQFADRCPASATCMRKSL